MEFDPVFLSRVQFAFLITFHIIFPAFTIGLAAWLATIEGMRLATGKALYRRVFDAWLLGRERVSPRFYFIAPWLAGGVMLILCVAFGLFFDGSILARSHLLERPWGFVFPLAGLALYDSLCRHSGKCGRPGRLIAVSFFMAG